MAKQIKCPSCSTWNPGSEQICVSCQSPLEPREAERSKQPGKTSYKDFVGKLKEQSGWLDNFFERSKSGNIFMKGLAYFLQTLWMIYFGILLFIAWLVFVVAG